MNVAWGRSLMQALNFVHRHVEYTQISLIPLNRLLLPIHRAPPLVFVCKYVVLYFFFVKDS